MQNLYSKLAQWLIKQTGADSKNYEIYKYGFQTGIEQGIFIITCIAVALFLNLLNSMLLFLLIFMLLRPYVGGFHCSKYFTCYILSLVTAVITVVVSNIIICGSIIIIFICVLLSLGILIYFFAFNKTISSAQYKYYALKLLRNLILIIIISVVAYTIHYKYVSTINFTLLILNVLSFGFAIIQRCTKSGNT